jgi:hypothetical protein
MVFTLGSHLRITYIYSESENTAMVCLFFDFLLVSVESIVSNESIQRSLDDKI